MLTQELSFLKVASDSVPNKVAGALVGALESNEVVEMQAIGAGAVNQALKAVAIARGFIAPQGNDLVCIPAFVDIVSNDRKITAIKIIVKKQ